MKRPTDQPSWIRWQVGVWAWGEPEFLVHLDRFWKTQVVKRAPPPYSPQAPANGWWPIDMVQLSGEWGEHPQNAYGLTAVRQEDDLIFFNDLANVLENKAWWHAFPSPLNLVCMMGGVTEKPAQYQQAATDVGVEPPKPGLVLLSPLGRVDGKAIDVYRSVARYSQRPGSEDDVYSAKATAALTQIWLEEFRAPAELRKRWQQACREQALDHALPSAGPDQKRARF